MRAIIRVSGGIGNQIFQIGFGDYLRKKYNSEIVYDISFYSAANSESTKRDFVGHLLYPKGKYENRLIFDLEYAYRVAEDSLWKKVFVRYKNFLLDIKYLLKNRLVIHKSARILRFWRLFGSKLSHVFVGSWQDFEYLSEEFNLEVSRNLEMVADPVSSLDLEDFIGVHIRRGDYLRGDSIHQVLKDDYYLNALNYLEKILGKRQVLLFSDDESISFNYKGGITFARNLAMDDMTQLFIMSRLRHLIIANSTFSAIAALIGEGNKDIVSPKDWFLGDIGIDVPRLPANWHRI